MRTVRTLRAVQHELWPRLAHVQLRSLLETDDRPPRAVIVGTSGSGKTAMIRSLRRRLESSGRDTADPAEPAVPVRTVVIADDSHLLPSAEIDRLIGRAEDPASALVVSVAAGPRAPAIDHLVGVLERSAPVIVLGRLNAADVRRAGDHSIASPCLDAIIDRTRGIAWLVSAALALHADSGCDDPNAHAEIEAGLAEAVAHRLDRLPPALRGYIESACLTRTHLPDEESIACAHAAGLLLRNGRPSPLVRAAVISAMAAEDVAAAWHDSPVGSDDAVVIASLGDLGDPRAARPLLMQAQEALTADPARAVQLFRAAAAAGASEASAGEAMAHRALGALDRAQSLLDAIRPGEEARGVPDAVAAIWAERGLAEESHAACRSRTARGVVGDLNAALSGLAIGDRAPLERAPAADHARPAALEVSVRMIMSGLRASFGARPADGLPDLVRGSELFTSSDIPVPTVELPAVVAGLAAIGVGDLELADSVLADAIRGSQGGMAGADRLRLWSAWVALQRERTQDAEAHIAAAHATPRPLGDRDRLLALALRLSIVRRYDDVSALEVEWRRARTVLLRTRFDLFSLLPLTEFAVAGARLKQSAVVDRHVEGALALLERSGDPVGWSAHLHWAGVQCGILGNAPERLAPHARALVSASAHNPLAARMAGAGKIWTAVLSGSVDADAVEAAALGLGEVGLAWDGARLAGHGAARSDDRKASAQLLACARRLHPAVPGGPGPETGVTTSARGHTSSGLSTRELEVADLVLQGKTYAEIGQAIFISPRTAEHHIARIRTRLGATSRSDLIAKLRHLMAELHEPHDETTRLPTPDPLAVIAMRGD